MTMCHGGAEIFVGVQAMAVFIPVVLVFRESVGF